MKAALSFALLTACEAESICDTAIPSTCDPEETETWTGTARLDDFGWGCTNSTWWYDVYTAGRTGAARVDVQETGGSAKAPLAELHEVPERASDPYGYWDEFYVELRIVARDHDYEPGEETRFSCADEPNLSFRVRVDATDGTALGCGAFGHDPATWPECEPY